jgi:hypothetical protein
LSIVVDRVVGRCPMCCSSFSIFVDRCWTCCRSL